MGGRRLASREVDREEPIDAHVRRLPEQRPESLNDRVLALQRDYGNAAVTQLVVQRRDRPQSTDAPGAKKKRKPQKAEAESYAPTERNKKFANTGDTELSKLAEAAMERGGHNNFAYAAECYEELWLRGVEGGNTTAARTAAMVLYRIYKKLGDEKRASFWLAVHHSRTGRPASAEDDMSDKQF